MAAIGYSLHNVSARAPNARSSLSACTPSGHRLVAAPCVDADEHRPISTLQVVYRGFSTSKKLQQMHDEAVAKRTELRLSSETARVEQAEAAMLLRSREERSQGEQELAAASAKHEIELARLKAEQQREERDADHAQALRHEQEKADAALAIRKQEHDEELRRAAALKQLDVRGTPSTLPRP
jgi:septal ring factor EnvC (AmiA/AmiB activator)